MNWSYLDWAANIGNVAYNRFKCFLNVSKEQHPKNMGHSPIMLDALVDCPFISVRQSVLFCSTVRSFLFNCPFISVVIFE